MIHVCSLARLHETVATTGARHVVSLLAREANLVRPTAIAPENHLWLQLHDISMPLDGYVAPQIEHVEELIAFVQRWPRDKPLVMHCYAGVSRSAAAAFVSVCALSPVSDEKAVAIALRRASPTATPNMRIVALADHLLTRSGRMVKAIEAIGPGVIVPEATPFRLDLPFINATCR
ncbi:MAG TPA: protein tyrosine phosphatase [Xanthobacteraceae bacterium]|nr:protein tyrosine phosphatase [Xanthobacteraceae bacterium]